jgi:hypothetical protein
MTTTQYPLTISRQKLIENLREAARFSDDTQHWIAVRVYRDGTIAVVEEVGRCVSEAEYLNQMPHAVTVWSRQGGGQCNWTEEDENLDLYQDTATECIEKLEDAGYEVTEQ